MRRGERVKLWEKPRPLNSLRELLQALISLPKRSLPRKFMTPGDPVYTLLFLYFEMSSPVILPWDILGDGDVGD